MMYEDGDARVEKWVLTRRMMKTLSIPEELTVYIDGR